MIYVMKFVFVHAEIITQIPPPYPTMQVSYFIVEHINLHNLPNEEHH